MKKCFFLAFIILSTFSCKNNQDGEKIYVIQLVPKMENENYQLYYLNNELFTGIAYEDNIEEKSYYKYTYKKGQVELLEGFSIEEVKQVEIPFKYGIRHGISRTWYGNGNKQSEDLFENGQRICPCKKWDTFGNLTDFVKPLEETN